MNTRARPLPYLERTPSGAVAWWLLAVFFSGVMVLMASVAAASGAPVSQAWHRGFLWAAGVLLLPLPFLTLAHLQAQRGVWMGRVAPLAAWRQGLTDHRRTLLLCWCLMALPLAFLRLLAGPQAATPAGPADAFINALWPLAALSGLLGCALLLAAALAGLLAWPWGLAGAAGLAAAPLADQAPGHIAIALVAGAALAVLGPLAMARVHRSLAGAPLRTGAPLGPGPWRRLARVWSPFSERWRTELSPAHGGAIMAIAPQFFVQHGLNDRQGLFFQPWGSSVSSLHGLRLLLLTFIAATLLRGAVLHWRVLLAPGGQVRRRLGLSVVGSTLVSLVVYVVLALLLVLAVRAALPFLPQVPWRELPGLVVAYGVPLLADLCLAVALAAWLRALLGSLLRVGLLCGAAGLLLVLASAVAGPLLGIEGALQWARTPLWQRDVAHHAISFGLAGLFTLLAQRAWMKADLSDLARRTRTRQEQAQIWRT